VLHDPSDLRVITPYAIVPASGPASPTSNPTGELHASSAALSRNAATLDRAVWMPTHAEQQLSTNRGTTMTSHRHARLVLAALATATGLGLGASACNSHDDAHPASSTPHPSSASPGTTTASPADIAKQRATKAYLGMWRDMADTATTSDWQSPTLAQNATGAALSRISRGLYVDHYNGLVSQGLPENNPTVESVEPVDNPTTVNIVDCGDDSRWVKYRVDNGQPANDGPGGRRHINAIAKKAVDGSWKVADFAIQDVGTC
jgi:hypothetical protein